MIVIVIMTSTMVVVMMGDTSIVLFRYQHCSKQISCAHTFKTYSNPLGKILVEPPFYR